MKFEIIFPLLYTSVIVQCTNSSTFENIITLCLKGEAGERAPQWHLGKNPDTKVDLTLSVSPFSDKANIVLWIDPRKIEYKTPINEFQWDFWKIVLGLLNTKIARSGICLLHAGACEHKGKTVLFPGISGAGKSTIAFIMHHLGRNVISSELTYLHERSIVAANSKANIDTVTLNRFCQEYKSCESRKQHFNLPELSSRHKIDLIVFPKITDDELIVRECSPRRARMLLFENAFSEHPISSLIDQHTIPLGLLPDIDDITAIASAVGELSSVNCFFIEGHPLKIIEHVFG